MTDNNTSEKTDNSKATPIWKSFLMRTVHFKTRKSKYIALVILIAILGVTILGLKKNGQVSPSDAAEKLEPVKERQKANVEVMKLVPQDFEIYSTYIGYLLPKERITLKNEIEGIVEAALFEEGDKVKAGDVLVNISTNTLKIRKELAASNYQLAKINFERESQLYKKKLTPPANFDIARNQLEQSKFSLQLAEIELAKSIVVSPMNGLIKTKGINRGEYLNKGNILAEILDISEMEVLINIPENKIRFLKPNMKVQVSLDATDGGTYLGRVTNIGIEANQNNRSFPVKIQLPNPDGAFRAGMLARVKLRIGEYKQQLLVPCHAIMERNTGKIVFVVKSNVAYETSVQTGECHQENIHIVSGLTPDNLVVISGQQQLITKEPVQITKILEQQ